MNNQDNPCRRQKTAFSVKHIRLLAFSLIVLVVAMAPAYADVITGSEDPAKFGNLKQGATNCKDGGCGPTAAINSFVYLQNLYSGIYGQKLVPHKDGNTAYQDEVDAANNLATFMGCCGGLYIEQFIIGKQKYIDKSAPGSTIYGAMDEGKWRPDKVGNSPKPAYVQDQVSPTAQFLVDALNKGSDVELFIDFVNDGDHKQHYVTLTYLKFDTGTKTGEINFIDPLTGKVADTKYKITGLDAKDMDLLLDYPGFPSASIFAAVSEAPVPEPGGMLLLGTGILVLGGMVRRQFSNRN